MWCTANANDSHLNLGCSFNNSPTVAKLYVQEELTGKIIPIECRLSVM